MRRAVSIIFLLVLGCQLLAVEAFQGASTRYISRPSLVLAAKKKLFDDDDDAAKEPGRMRRAVIASTLLATTQLLFASYFAPPGFKRVPMKFIAATGDPKSKEGTNANEWGLWGDDPGPRGVYLKDYDDLVGESNGYGPDGWVFTKNDWWLEEHGIIMPAPDFPMPPGRYLVTGGRLVTTGLTIGENGHWSLDKGTLFDVTHLPCRSARYHPDNSSTPGSPATAKRSDFPVFPGAAMPEVAGCDKQDYAVLFIVGKAVEESE